MIGVASGAAARSLQRDEGGFIARRESVVLFASGAGSMPAGRLTFHGDLFALQEIAGGEVKFLGSWSHGRCASVDGITILVKNGSATVGRERFATLRSLGGKAFILELPDNVRYRGKGV